MPGEEMGAEVGGAFGRMELDADSRRRAGQAPHFAGQAQLGGRREGARAVIGGACAECVVDGRRLAGGAASDAERTWSGRGGTPRLTLPNHATKGKFTVQHCTSHPPSYEVTCRLNTCLAAACDRTACPSPDTTPSVSLRPPLTTRRIFFLYCYLNLYCTTALQYSPPITRPC